jgi:hypothetical protein
VAQIISGPGVPLPYPQNLYPSELNNAPNDAPTNLLTLAPGQVLPIPATGTNGWAVDPGPYGVLQWLDPVTGAWRGFNSARSPFQVLSSDGFTRRVANLTGCPFAAIVANGGSGFAASTATISANVGGSTWQAIVGGSLSVSTISVVGANYTVAPEVFIPAPPNPGVQATAYASLTSGTVSSVSLVNFGAGYTSGTLNAVLIPNPADPNIGTITQATVVLVLNAANSGAITAALCTNFGAPLATLSALTLTAAGGAGTGATITPVIMQTVQSVSVVAGGGGWGNVAAPAFVTTAGGVPVSVSAIKNPAIEQTGYIPRQAQIGVTTSASGGLSAPVIIDGGLFAGTPTAVIVGGGTLPTTLASVALTMGTANTSVLLQPL